MKADIPDFLMPSKEWEDQKKKIDERRAERRNFIALCFIVPLLPALTLGAPALLITSYKQERELRHSASPYQAGMTYGVLGTDMKVVLVRRWRGVLGNGNPNGEKWFCRVDNGPLARPRYTTEEFFEAELVPASAVAGVEKAK